MAIVEDITDETDAGPSSDVELIQAIKELAKQLALPEGLLPEYMAHTPDQYQLERYGHRALGIVQDIAAKAALADWEMVEVDEQVATFGNVLRLYGDDPWTSPQICQVVDGITSCLSPMLPQHILPTLRPYFSPHPSLSAANRALTRPTGGKDSTIDLHDSQPFKSSSAWGVSNLLSWSVSHMSEIEIERNIGMILPPTLVMMDDWEPSWREKAALIFEKWMDNLDPTVMRRMGIDKLLVDSLIHTLSLHSNPPLKRILEITLKLVKRCTDEGEKRTKRYEEIVDKALVQGWIYAPSGVEGRVVLVHIAEQTELICEVLGTGIVRWLKTIIPHLLEPLQYPPTSPVLPHFRANLSALLCVMRTVRATERIGRWRGQILNILSRLWVQMKERQGVDDDDDDRADIASLKPLQELVKQIFIELATQTPSVNTVEYPRLLAQAPTFFADLIPVPSQA
ncbi:hypothetical protein CI109_100864 [Kwoniella shandongensis]|uniref:Uncharacterized protein n=1 Tax=Kwoniella shandongensis TaxID=1734106 RepID=A0A5M6BRW7_9TREE|nr:uncharacterized protein CI109_006116 [Kwoniella shandongensis]KAA5525543.1 hypothetical protein CI109_006116 [Kwoniella shandongensis]